MLTNTSTTSAPGLVARTELPEDQSRPEARTHQPAADAGLGHLHDLDREALLGARLPAVLRRAVGQLMSALQQENAARQRAEHELQWYREHLEELVGQRTAALQAANARLVEAVARRDEAARREVAEAEEHKLIARDHHDAATQALFSASLIAEALPEAVTHTPERARRGADALRQLTRGALAEMRTLLYQLRPATFGERPLSELLVPLCNAFASRARIDVELEIEEPCVLQPASVQTVFYHAAHEALANVWRHAEAGHVIVRAVSSPDLVRVEVSDDGKGLEPVTSGSSAGPLAVLRERAAAIGAKLHVESRPGAGTTVQLSWSPAAG